MPFTVWATRPEVDVPAGSDSSVTVVHAGWLERAVEHARRLTSEMDGHRGASDRGSRSSRSPLRWDGDLDVAEVDRDPPRRRRGEGPKAGACASTDGPADVARCSTRWSEPATGAWSTAPARGTDPADGAADGAADEEGRVPPP